MVQWFKANGFQPRAMAMTDIMTGLTTGMIDALPTTPLAALLFQWYKQTPYMLDIGLAPVVGATVVDEEDVERAFRPPIAPKLLASPRRRREAAAGRGAEAGRARRCR